ncbi:MAG: Asp-tRNA(Asn)/Glu-tRNA(Gln) amidotransferase subunit GatC [Gemmatimonadota bacterium]|nr:Asp-tRNA(Asn)/Glu-tRNA(Gln) amidotransferase subunit GatC [Gemmatimonadota bacterium]
MAVTTEEVHGVAELARLRFSPAEEERLAGELNRILRYMDTLNELDTTGVEPTSHVLPLANAFRRDEAASFPAAAEIVAAAPQRQEDYFKVPRIID